MFEKQNALCCIYLAPVADTGQTQIAVNDDWQAATSAAAIQAAGFAPANANEAAILLTLNPGAYTAIVTGVGGTTGVGIIEVFAP